MANVYNFPKAKRVAGAVGRLGDAAPPSLQVGSRGQAVMDVQERLNRLGYGLTVDGIFGSQTEAAVKQFQKDTGLLALGVVDSVTWANLDAKTKDLPGATYQYTAQNVQPQQVNFTDPTVITGTPPAQTPPSTSIFPNTIFGIQAKSLAYAAGGLALLGAAVWLFTKGSHRRGGHAMSGYARYIDEVSSRMETPGRTHGPVRSKQVRGTSARKSCARTPASKMLVSGEVIR